MGLSRSLRAWTALAAIVGLSLLGTSAASAATLSSDEPVPLGSRAIEPVVDRNAAGLIEAFDFVAKSDGPVDVVNVYLDRYAGTPNLSRPNARLHAGIYANGANNRPGALLGKGLLANFNHHNWNTVPITPVELEKGKHYWIAVMGTVEEISLHTNADRPATGTSASATSPRNQSQLPAN